MAEHDNTSVITGRVRKTLVVTPGAKPGTSNGDTIEESAQRTRSTEVTALIPRAKSPAYRAWQCAYWARIAMNPRAHPEVADVNKPARAQTGYRMLVWVGSKVGLSPEDVEAHLKKVDGYLETER